MVYYLLATLYVLSCLLLLLVVLLQQGKGGDISSALRRRRQPDGIRRPRRRDGADARDDGARRVVHARCDRGRDIGTTAASVAHGGGISAPRAGADARAGNQRDGPCACADAAGRQAPTYVGLAGSIALLRESGGTGRRTSLRGWRSQERGGSNPPFRIPPFAPFDSQTGPPYGEPVCSLMASPERAKRVEGQALSEVEGQALSEVEGRANDRSNALSECSESKGGLPSQIPRTMASSSYMPWVYILRCSDDTLYVGHTTDLASREQTHNEGRGGRYTAQRRPVTIVYSERHDSAQSALARERQLKRWTTVKKEALVTGDRRTLKRVSRSRQT